MLETLMTSKVRSTLIKHFLGHQGERFYLRQLERLLELPLTPARRELIRLTQMGMLKEEQEANLKFYRLNEGFEYLEELRKLIGISGVGADLRVRPDEGAHIGAPLQGQPQGVAPTRNWLAPVFGLVALLTILQAGLFYVWTHPFDNSKVLVGADPRVRPNYNVGAGFKPAPTEGQPRGVAPTLAADSYVMSSGKARLESGGFGGWQ